MRFQVLPVLITICLLFNLANVSNADYEYDYFSDRLSREYRDAGDLEDWIERGNSTVTASPQFPDGVRLSAWESEYKDDESYEFALVSAVYLFSIPKRAQHIEITVRYRGEPRKSHLEDYAEVAGRVWIRNTKRELAEQAYDDEHANETLYGDTFVLRAKRRAETIKIAAANHVDDDEMELHIVASDDGQLDIESISVSTYRHRPEIRVEHRYVNSYRWSPWHRYSYLYFYNGPLYYNYPGYYARWDFPFGDRSYLLVRHSYSSYYGRYYDRYPNRRYYRGSRRSRPLRAHRFRGSGMAHRVQLSRWSNDHQKVRAEYVQSRKNESGSRIDHAQVQSNVRMVVRKNRKNSMLLDQVASGTNSSSRWTRNDLRRQSSHTFETSIGKKRYTDNRSRLTQHMSAGATKRRRSGSFSRTQIYNSQSNSTNQSGVQRSVSKRAVSSRSRSSLGRDHLERRRKSDVVRSRPSSGSSSSLQKRRSSSRQNSDDDNEKDRSRSTSRTKRRRK